MQVVSLCALCVSLIKKFRLHHFFFVLSSLAELLQIRQTVSLVEAIAPPGQEGWTRH